MEINQVALKFTKQLSEPSLLRHGNVFDSQVITHFLDYDVTLYALDGDQKQIAGINLADKEVGMNTDWLMHTVDLL